MIDTENHEAERAAQGGVQTNRVENDEPAIIEEEIAAEQRSPPRLAVVRSQE